MKLWESENISKEIYYKSLPLDQRYKQIIKELGISENLLQSAIKYTNFVEEEPELAKSVAPHIVIETASLPKEERKEVLEI